MSPNPKPGVTDIVPYVGGRAGAPGAEIVFKLSSNESVVGPSPNAVKAFESVASRLNIYPEGSARALREVIADIHDLNAGQIVCGNGSNELLTLLATCYLQPGDEVLYSQHAFIVYRIAALSSSAIPVAIPEKNLRADVDAMVQAITPRTRLIYIANPNNPTGSYLTREELARLHAALPASALLVIDGAYAEYVRHSDYESGLGMVQQFDNVVATRTLSKIYGLAGLRVGWAYCPIQVADILHRVRAPFNVSVPALAAAVEAVRDQEHVKTALVHNDYWRDWLTSQIRSLGLRVSDSVANFILIHFPAEGTHTADAADRFLSAQGLILRGVANYELPHCLRMTIGDQRANAQVVAALRQFLAEG